MHSEYYETLIHKHLSGELTPEEQAQFDVWLESSPGNRQRLEEAERIWTLSASAGSELDIDLDHEMARFKTRIARVSEPKATTPVFKLRLLRYAAAAVLLIGGVLLILQNRDSWTNQDMVVVQTIAGESKEIVLPDESTVWLNENSKLAYAAGFDNRDIELNGEAFFDVEHNPANPFDITTGQGQIQVLGTSFGIRNRSADDLITVTVATGLVSLTNSSTGQQEVLEAGYQGILQKSDNSLVQKPNDNPEFLSWRNRPLVFNNTSFDNVVEQLRAHFAIVIESPDTTLAACTLTGEMESATLEEVIELLSFSLNIEVAVDQGVYAFTSTGCSQ